MNIPNFDIQTLTDADGKFTQEAYGFFQLLVIALQKNLSNESIITPQQSASNISSLNNGPANPNDYTGGVLYNNTVNKFMGNIGGTFQYFLTSPTGIISSADGGTGVDNGGFTLTLNENVTFAGGFDITFNTTGLSNITLPTSGTLVVLNSSPTFLSETLTNTTNQLVLGTTNTTTINSSAPSASRTITIPDALSSSNITLSTQGAVTQLTSITTGVSITGTSGIITTVSLTTAASTNAGAFIVTNPFYTSSSQVILVTAAYGTSTTGIPIATLLTTNPGSNQFTIDLFNLSTSAAFNGTILINFLIT